MSGWMTIRVTLTGGGGRDLAQPPTRVMLAHVEHGLDELADAVNVAFGRWDLGPLHTFRFDGRRYMLAEGEPLEEGWEPSEETGLGDLDLAAGDRFAYVFDLDEEWRHDCIVEDVDVDPDEWYGEEPDVPVPVWGWGMIPDQHWRLTDEDSEELDDPVDIVEPPELDSWTAPEEEAWGIVEAALGPAEQPEDSRAVTSAVDRLRAERDDEAIGILWSIAGEPDAALGDADLWIALASGVVTPRRPPRLEPDRDAAWAALEPADWAGAVIELARAGEGAPADPEALFDHIRTCPEVEDEELTEEDERVVMKGLAVVAELLTTLGAIDEDGRLTRLGVWGLPLALRSAWAEPLPRS